MVILELKYVKLISINTPVNPINLGITDAHEADINSMNIFQNVAPTCANDHQVRSPDDMTHDVLPENVYTILDKYARFGVKYPTIVAAANAANAAAAVYTATSHDAVSNEYLMFSRNLHGAGANSLYCIYECFYANQNNAGENLNAVLQSMKDIIDQYSGRVGTLYATLSRNDIGLNNKCKELIDLLTPVYNEFKTYFVETACRSAASYYISKFVDLSKDPNVDLNMIQSAGIKVADINDLHKRVIRRGAMYYIRIFDLLFNVWYMDIIFSNSIANGELHKMMNLFAADVYNNVNDHYFTDLYNQFHKQYTFLLNAFRTRRFGGKYNRILSYNYNNIMLNASAHDARNNNNGLPPINKILNMLDRRDRTNNGALAQPVVGLGYYLRGGVAAATPMVNNHQANDVANVSYKCIWPETANNYAGLARPLRSGTDIGWTRHLIVRLNNVINIAPMFVAAGGNPNNCNYNGGANIPAGPALNIGVFQGQLDALLADALTTCHDVQVIRTANNANPIGQAPAPSQYDNERYRSGANAALNNGHGPLITNIAHNDAAGVALNNGLPWANYSHYVYMINDIMTTTVLNIFASVFAGALPGLLANSDAFLKIPWHTPAHGRTVFTYHRPDGTRLPNAVRLAKSLYVLFKASHAVTNERAKYSDIIYRNECLSEALTDPGISLPDSLNANQQNYFTANDLTDSYTLSGGNINNNINNNIDDDDIDDISNSMYGGDVNKSTIINNIFKNALLHFNKSASLPTEAAKSSFAGKHNNAAANQQASIAINNYVTDKLVQLFRGFDLLTKYVVHPAILAETDCPFFDLFSILYDPHEVADVNGGQLDNICPYTYDAVFYMTTSKVNLIFDYYKHTHRTDHDCALVCLNTWISYVGLAGHVNNAGAARVIPAYANVDKETLKMYVKKYMSTVYTNLDIFAGDNANAARASDLNDILRHHFVIKDVDGMQKIKVTHDPTNAAHAPINYNFNLDAYLNAGNVAAVVTEIMNFYASAPSNVGNYHDYFDQAKIANQWIFAKPDVPGGVVKSSAETFINRGIKGGNTATSLNNKHKNVLFGGAVDIKSEIYLIAVTIARSLSTRAIYRDTSIKDEKIIPIATFQAAGPSLPQESFYLYKLLYNPHLASKHNKSNLNDADFVNTIIGKYNKFIINPLESTNTPLDFDGSKLANSVDYDVYAFMKSLEPANQQTYKNAAVFGNITVPNNSLYLSLIGNNNNFNTVNVTINDNDNYAQVFANHHGIVGVPVPANGFMPIPILDPVVLNSRDTYYNCLVRRTIHDIHFDEKMLANVPYNAALDQYIFSPQKDIFNVTFSADPNTPRAATLSLGIPDASYIFNGKLYINVPQIYHWLDTIDADSYIPGQPVALTFNANNDAIRQSIKHNILHQFIDKLVMNNAQYMLTNVQNNMNLGFDIGYANDRIALFGGSIKYNDKVTNRFVNTDHEIFGATTKEVLRSAYNIPNDADTIHDDGRNLYCSLFKNFNFKAMGKDMYRLVFAYVADYFNKNTISFNAIYNQLCFTSIIYTTAVYKSYIPKLRNVFAGAESSLDKLKKTHKFVYSIYEFIKRYMYYYSIDDGSTNASDIAENPDFQILDSSFSIRSPDMTFNTIVEKLSKVYNNGAIVANQLDNQMFMIANQYIAPSVNSNIFSELVNLISYIPINSRYRGTVNINSQNANIELEENKLFVRKDYDHDEVFKSCEDLYQLMSSGVMNSIRHFDTTATFLYTTFLWLKQTSYYDNKRDADVSYFGNSIVEPFSIS